MTLELDEKEKAYLLEVLKRAHEELLHELHHTDTNNYKSVLRNQLAIQEGLEKKLQQLK